MLIFDIRSGYLILGAVYFILPIYTWFVLHKHRNISIDLWCGAGVIFSICGPLINLRGILPDILTYGVVNSLIFLGLLFRVISLNIKDSKNLKIKHIFCYLVLFFLVYETIRQYYKIPIVRYMYSNIFFFAFDLIIAFSFYLRADFKNSINSKSVAICYFIEATTIGARIIDVLFFYGMPDSISKGTPSIIIFFSLLLTVIISHIGYIGVAYDKAISMIAAESAERAKQEERESLGLIISQLDRQRALGEMSNSFSHEINQPLTVIRSLTQHVNWMIDNDNIDKETLNNYQEIVIKSVDRASDVIKKIASFIKPSLNEYKPLSLYNLLVDAIYLFDFHARKNNITINKNFGNDNIYVLVDATQITQVLVNLIRNAIDSSIDNGGSYVSIYIERKSKNVLIKIYDSGAGFTNQVLNNIGSPFFTTKSNGLGLGISISNRIISQHKGNITFHNFNGNGLVLLQLPLYQSSHP